MGKRDILLQIKETYLTPTIGKRDLAYRVKETYFSAYLRERCHALIAQVVTAQV
jgi:translation initiation factor IF-3